MFWKYIFLWVSKRPNTRTKETRPSRPNVTKKPSNSSPRPSSAIPTITSSTPIVQVHTSTVATMIKHWKMPRHASRWIPRGQEGINVKELRCSISIRLIRLSSLTMRDWKWILITLIFRRICRPQLRKRIKRPILNSTKPTSQHCWNSCSIPKPRIFSRIPLLCRNCRLLCRILSWLQPTCSRIQDCRKSSTFSANNQVPMILKTLLNNLMHRNSQRSQVNPNQRRKNTLLLPHHLNPKQRRRNLRKWKSKILQRT